MSIRSIYENSELVGRSFKTPGSIRSTRRCEPVSFDVTQVDQKGLQIRNSLGNVRPISNKAIDGIVAYLEGRIDLEALRNNFNLSYLLGIAYAYNIKR